MNSFGRNPGMKSSKPPRGNIISTIMAVGAGGGAGELVVMPRMRIKMNCPFCPDRIKRSEIILENDLCLFLQQVQPVLIGSGIIIPKAHRRTVFDLTDDELSATFSLLSEVKEYLDTRLQPDGYNVGWNNEDVAGQEVFHAHMHVIPRFTDEPFAGRGIRYWLKQEENIRHNKTLHRTPLDGAGEL